ncbi:MAG: TRAP transporter large permease subunit [Verrucomicrobia bacterium]|nr:TRAP transporter large permease subunit [Verrucomicrobiota bacterium]
MSGIAETRADPSPALPPDPAQPLPWWRSVENLAVVIVLAAMTSLPLVDILFRWFGRPGLAGSASFVQHLTLLAGVIGGALAARDNRLLSLSAATTFLKGRWRDWARFGSGAFAAAISTVLALASAQFVLFEREGGNTLAYGIPVWWVQAFLPLGFAAVALRLWLHASDRWRGRAAALLLAAALVGLAVWTPVAPARLLWPALGLLFLATLAGAPVFVTLGGAALILFWSDGLPLASIPLDHYRLVTNPTLPTIPLFTLAGYFLAEGGASRRLVRVFQALVGARHGGPAIVTALVCAFFTSFTGASGVTILALGALLMPVLLAARYSERASLGLLTSSGSLGLLFPPCLPLILYAIIAKVGISEVFLGGMAPGLLLVAATAWWGWRQAPRLEAEQRRFDASEAARAIWEARWELLLPVVALGSLLSGLATPVEAAALTAGYAFVVETFVYRDLRLIRDVPRVMTECGLLVGGILLILGVALGFTNYLIDAQVAAHAVEWATANIHSPLVFLIMLNFFLLLVGCLMDIYSAIVVVVPLIVPLGLAFNVDPVHLGILFLANLELGYLTPPVGMNLFLASYRFGKPLTEVARAVLPFVGLRLVVVLLITYVPALTTTLPQWFKPS